MKKSVPGQNGVKEAEVRNPQDDRLIVYPILVDGVTVTFLEVLFSEFELDVQDDAIRKIPWMP